MNQPTNTQSKHSTDRFIHRHNNQYTNYCSEAAAVVTINQPILNQYTVQTDLYTDSISIPTTTAQKQLWFGTINQQLLSQNLDQTD